MIEINNLSKDYDLRYRKGLFRTNTISKTAIQDVSLKFELPEITGIVGNNGAGKTTLMKMICGLLHPTSGKVSVLDEDPYKKNPLILKKIAFLSGRKDSLFWDLPVLDSFRLHKYIYRIDNKEFLQRYKLLSELFSAENLLHKQARSLSLGERLTCELIKSLLHNPKILLLDEPTIGLDLETQIAFRKHLKMANKEDKSIVLLSSHNMEDISNTCSRMVGLTDGKIVFDDSIDKVSATSIIDKEYKIRFEDPKDQSLHTAHCNLENISVELNTLLNDGMRIVGIEKDSQTFSQSIMNIITRKSNDHV